MSNPWENPQPYDPNQPGFPAPGGPEQAGPAYGYPPAAGPAYPGGAGVPYPQPFPSSPPSYPGYPSAGYPPPGYPMQAPPEHPQSVTAMVLGILGLVCCGLASPFAIWTGRKAMNEIDASGGWMRGRGQAQAGFIMGIIGTALWVLGILFYVVMIGLAASRQTTGLT